MIFKKDNSLSFGIYFILYLAINTIFIVLFIAILYIFIELFSTKPNYSLVPLFFKDITNYLIPMFVLSPYIYYKIQDNVQQLQIDETRREIKVYYKNIIFQNKMKIFDIDNIEFSYKYKIEKKTNFFKRLLASTLGTSVVLFYNNKTQIVIRDTSGWGKKQLESIIRTLEELKPSIKHT